jgi:enoyl-CoA hydratase/carnithine racemase
MEDYESLVLTTIDRGVAHVVLNRPERQNAWTPAMGVRYFETLDALARDGEVRAIVVSGAGGAFCPGADPGVLGDIVEGEHRFAPDKPPYWGALSVGKPVIGAIAGPCFGLGLQQALCFDIRFASEDAKFSTAYARRGLIAELGMSWLLPRLVGTAHAADLLLSARLIRAPEAARIGLVNRVVPTGEVEREAVEYARAMAATCSPRAMREIKAQLYQDLADRLIPAYERSDALLHAAVTWPDFAEGVESWKAQRPPAFPPLPSALAKIDVEPPQ